MKKSFRKGKQIENDSNDEEEEKEMPRVMPMPNQENLKKEEQILE